MIPGIQTRVARKQFDLRLIIHEELCAMRSIHPREPGRRDDGDGIIQSSGSNDETLVVTATQTQGRSQE